MKEVNGRDLYLNGDVLPRADDFDGVEEYADEKEDEHDLAVQRDLTGYAQRIAYQRDEALRLRNISQIEDASALREALEDRDGKDVLPIEVMRLLYDAAHEENRLRSFGANALRIASKVDTPLRIKVLRMQLHGVDVSNVFPPASNFFQDESSQVSDSEIQSVRDRKIEVLMNGRGLSYADAEKLVD